MDVPLVLGLLWDLGEVESDLDFLFEDVSCASFTVKTNHLLLMISLAYLSKL